jgi:hypothetical protein
MYEHRRTIRVIYAAIVLVLIGYLAAAVLVVRFD